MTLRPYQQKTISSLRSSISAGNKRMIMCAPTGSGKTIMFSYMVATHVRRGGRVLILTHRIELLKQAGGAFARFNLSPETIEAGKVPDLTQSLHVAMIETLSRRAARYEFFIRSRTMIIIDEAHLNHFSKIFPYISADTFVIGATATPYRKGKSVPALSEFYQDIVQEVDVPELLSLGFLTPAKSYGVKVGLEDAKLKGTDYDTSEIYKKNRMWTGVLDNWERVARNTKTLLFASNVESSKDVCQEFQARGYPAKHLDGRMGKKERKEVLDWFDCTDDAVLCNCSVLTTGFDQPDIQTIILYRATTSLPLFLQMCGRGSRIHPGKKHFNILDFGENINRLGFWEEPRTWSLEKDERRVSKEQVAPTKDCPECMAMLHASVRACKYCGHQFPVSEKEREEVRLQELSYDEITAAISDMGMEEVERLRIARGYKVAWVAHQLRDAGRIREYGKFKGYKNGWADRMIKMVENGR